MGKEENLKPNSERTPTERKELARKAGKKSGEVRRERKTMKEMLDYLLSKEITNNKGEKATTLEAMMTATIKKAIQGDVRAVQFVRDTIGEMPINKHEVDGLLNTNIQKVYVTKEDKAKVDEHIEKFING